MNPNALMQFQEFMDQAIKIQRYHSEEAMIREGLNLICQRLNMAKHADAIIEAILREYKKGRGQETHPMIYDALRALQEKEGDSVREEYERNHS